MKNKIIECVPNISEGSNSSIINTIANEIKSVKGIKLINIDSGEAANRTVFTFLGEPENVVKAAFKLIKKTSELIDMSIQKGEHPRFGATDVCPLIPISNISIEETIEYANNLGKKVGNELEIPVYLYESSATSKERINLANCRAGEYEGLANKMLIPKWKPDFGPSIFNESVKKTGAIAIGARKILIAYNINLNTSSKKIAHQIASELRESGKIKRDENGFKVLDKKGKTIRIPGKLKALKGIGWYIEDFKKAQVSYNLTDIDITPLHIVFEETVKTAKKFGVKVTGSELIGLIPLQSMIDTADYFLKKENQSINISEKDKINYSINKLGLNELKSFNPEKNIIDYNL
ncbi:glutamate formimidoyltransferase [Urechidicola croceus]|uniref:glutamate formimidoyltransferase n=1 Tax=Urechidicola croceus TaxID=1850246 RepID=A0A1D8P4I1_9FLAO|nr:glutamate formimidoyltransferase [Urechidicola croceus]AOW19493.1 glutamate formimidoyltransferase [Urechidicola croceus]